jgi:hypothetical protein
MNMDRMDGMSEQNDDGSVWYGHTIVGSHLSRYRIRGMAQRLRIARVVTVRQRGKSN